MAAAAGEEPSAASSAAPAASAGHYAAFTPKTEARRFPCDICGKAFTRKYNLEAHVLSHNNVKPFTCTYDGCGEMFVRKYDLNRHIVSVHERALFGPCPFCGRSYSRSDSYRKHVRLEERTQATGLRIRRRSRTAGDASSSSSEAGDPPAHDGGHGLEHATSPGSPASHGSHGSFDHHHQNQNHHIHRQQHQHQHEHQHQHQLDEHDDRMDHDAHERAADGGYDLEPRHALRAGMDLDQDRGIHAEANRLAVAVSS
ncbi:hypothetical protein HK105_200977 [Polyrhizophydium stewartii]|uniref:C2H2-type domain-containing protein n=1 Tax=Polyrhizophydium stewartii TaxID=2732419 RepID=A0ABR4NIP2_9FUNG